MTQFDPLIIFSLIFSLFVILSLYYLYQIENSIPYYTETKKFRQKRSFNLKNLKESTKKSFYFYSIDFKYLTFLS